MNRNKMSQDNFVKAKGKLGEVLVEWRSNPNDIVRDAVIQRFEFTFETAWKALKRVLEDLGLPDRNSPREVIKESYVQELITGEDIWLQMIRDRNLTLHLYLESLAKEIADRVNHDYEQAFQQLIDALHGKNQ